VGSAQRIVIFAYLFISVVAAITLARALSTLALALNVPDYPVLGSNGSLTDVIGFVVAAGAGIWAYRNPQVHEWSLDVINELRKVTWPSRKETQTATVVVIITTLLAAVVLGLFDQVWALVTSVIYSRPTS
jgi:preprotein translocase subunit SecE